MLSASACAIASTTSRSSGREALGLAGVTVIHDEISPETQHADLRHEPDPAHASQRRRLGLLGRLAAVLCLIEIYGHAPSAEELRACLTKHLAFWRQRARRARADNARRRKRGRRPRAFVAPFLWIISAGAPRALLSKLRPVPARGWPAGVYLFGDDVLRVGLVVARELPRDRSTLLVRLMAAGPHLPQTIEEIGALPPGAPDRAVAERILVDLQHVLEQKPIRTPEEQEFIVRMYKTFTNVHDELRALERVVTRAEDVLTVLRVRRIAVPAAVRNQILTETDPKQLERWLKKAAVAASIDEVIAKPRLRRARA